MQDRIVDAYKALSLFPIRYNFPLNSMLMNQERYDLHSPCSKTHSQPSYEQV